MLGVELGVLEPELSLLVAGLDDSLLLSLFVSVLLDSPFDSLLVSDEEEPDSLLLAFPPEVVALSVLVPRP
ncbi:MAG TPA: hypothetical protein VNJ02_08940 [Vicinamibacterales bacterium]|nr:hypothetical protein [Vicinamibacterales bacterium]